MNATYLREKGIARSGLHEYEEDVARRWWALPLNVNLPLTDGESCQLIYAGRPGSSPGPDIRDAILSFTSYHPGTGYAAAHNQVEHITGDVEIHIRTADWFVHQHHTDARYNNVVLHVVLICDNSRPILRQDGTVIPTCSLNDVSPTTRNCQPVRWPCHDVLAQLHEAELAHLFTRAGMLRFEMKAQGFFELLNDARPSGTFSAYDVCLIPALAEGLGFGRDRAFFRAAGLHLIGAVTTIPDPLGSTPKPSPLDNHRLHMLGTLVERWRTRSAWETVRQALLLSISSDACFRSPRDDASIPAPHHTALVPARHLEGLYQLRTIFHGLGTARTDILICNIVFLRERCQVYDQLLVVLLRF